MISSHDQAKRKSGAGKRRLAPTYAPGTEPVNTRESRTGGAVKPGAVEALLGVSWLHRQMPAIVSWSVRKSVLIA